VFADDRRDYPGGKRWQTFGPAHNQITHWARLNLPSLDAARKEQSGLASQLSSTSARAVPCGIGGMAKTTCPYCENSFAFEYQPPLKDQWEPLTEARVKSEDFEGTYWLALKDGTVTQGCYQWLQGWAPHGFNTVDRGRVSAEYVTHVMHYSEPAHPDNVNANAKVG